MVRMLSWSVLVWCQRQVLFWTVLLGWGLLWTLRSGLARTLEADPSSYPEVSSYDVACLAIVPGSWLGILALGRFQPLLTHAHPHPGSALNLVVLLTPSVPLAVVGLLVSPAAPSSLVHLLSAALVVPTVVAWAWLSVRFVGAGSGGALLYVAGLALERLAVGPGALAAPPASELPLLERVLPIVGLLLALGLLAPARTSTR